MRRCLPNALVVAIVATLSAPALAQDSNCPPGAWFCEESSQPTAPEEVRPTQEEDLTPPPPPHVRRGRPHIRFATPPPRPHAPPPVVVYSPPPPGAPPPQVVIVAPGARPRPATKVIVRAADDEPQRIQPQKRRWHRRWGLNLRVEGAALGGGDEHGGSEDAGMGGLGLSLRFRPVPAFAFDAGIDVLSGTDWNGFQRTEMPLSLSGMLFVNPKSRVQFYILGGIHYSHAEVESDTFEPLRDGDEDWDDGDVNTRDYSYFGGQGGIGLEFRISRLVALNVDVLGFIRERTDEGGPPEFTDPVTGHTTNTSGGGLLRGGLTFWW